jgi:hypothetical protein
MVCEAIVKLKVPLGPACVRACRARGDWRGPNEVPARALRLSSWGRGSACLPRWSGRMPNTAVLLLLVACSSGLRFGPVSDAESARASHDGAPPWAGAMWTRIRAAVTRKLDVSVCLWRLRECGCDRRPGERLDSVLESCFNGRLESMPGLTKAEQRVRLGCLGWPNTSSGRVSGPSSTSGLDPSFSAALHPPS